MTFTEEKYENAILEIFHDTLHYTHVYGPNIARDYADPLYRDELLPALRRINPRLPETALTEAVNKLCNFDGSTLLQKNIQFMNYLQNGVSVNYFDKGEQRYTLVYLVDFSDTNTDKNTFTVANQWTITENSEKRPDIIVFLNGLPVVVIELKSPSREDTDASEGYLQLRNYMHEIPSLFTYNAFLVMSDQAHTKAGTITAGEDRFMEWKTTDGSYESTQFADFHVFFEGMFDKVRFLDILRNFICFSGEVKILGAYHQYFAVRKAVDSTASATSADGRGGVFWHTQGSGKSLSMVFYAHLLQEVLHSPTLVVLTDRNDLDDQLFEQFAKCANFLRQSPEQATCRKLSDDYKKALKRGEARKKEIGLKDYLQGREANGIIFTTIQKIEEYGEPLSERHNIIVIADEAHRSQFVDERVTEKGEIKKSFGLVLRESLPNATYIGFTGTPIASKDRSTMEVFGNYIDVYDMTQAVEDGATRPVYYESRVIHLKLNEEILQQIDAEYDIMAQNAEEYAIEKSKQELGNIESILGADETINALCEDIIKHYEENRQYEQTGKAMIVAYSRSIAMNIYKTLIHGKTVQKDGKEVFMPPLRSEWNEKVGVVMTESNKDPEEWRGIIGNKRRRDELAGKFKDDNDSMKIAIVVDMWLTGFDVPSLATMYIYKPMAGHNLMQAIARVNRVYKDKEGGLVIDYVGIASALKQAMNDYTKRDRQNYGEQDIAKTALPKFIEKLEVCRNLMYGFDYSDFMNVETTDLARAKAISGGVNFLSAIKEPAQNKIPKVSKMLPASLQDAMVADVPLYAYGSAGDKSSKDVFIKEAMLLRQSLSLCRSLLNRAQRFEAAYFEAVRTVLTRLSGDSKPLSLKEINSRISELLKASIKSEGVINLFTDADKDFSLFDPKFLAEIANMKERNLAVELLKKLLSEQITVYKRTNLVKSEKFSERMAACMKAYINGLISNEEVIAELMKMASEMANANTEGEEMGLTEEELAFYDALTKPSAIKDFYQNDDLVAMTRELTDMLRKNRTIDWQKKDSARAGMRRMVKKLLKKYKYPPEGMEDAVATVIGQCEMWSDN
ncbi:MAG: type I restriction endonuclease subunit R [Lachnospiraceae bacterium]|jgi:type I restriction enzyme R subunit|nr:type I restriction endonuclease subunit R [Lachnospiraceae bacterium]